MLDEAVKQRMFAPGTCVVAVDDTVEVADEVAERDAVVVAVLDADTDGVFVTEVVAVEVTVDGQLLHVTGHFSDTEIPKTTFSHPPAAIIKLAQSVPSSLPKQ